MFETDVVDRTVGNLVMGAIDEAGGSPRRWVLLLGAALAAALAVLWFAKRAATDEVVHVPDASGPG
jgi:hypothetical protein